MIRFFKGEIRMEACVVCVDTWLVKRATIYYLANDSFSLNEIYKTGVKIEKIVIGGKNNRKKRSVLPSP